MISRILRLLATRRQPPRDEAGRFVSQQRRDVLAKARELAQAIGRPDLVARLGG